jgi:hypothetical protein
MKSFVIFSIFILNFSLSAKVKNSKCIRKHLLDAIQINKLRKPLYKVITDGKSKTLSNRLIFSERIALVYAIIFDYKAKKYQKRGIPLFCLDFIDMKEISEFQEGSYIPTHRYDSVEKIDTSEIISKINRTLEKESFQGVQRLLSLELQKLEDEKSYNCLSKHVLESIRRSAFLAPHYIAAAELVGLKSPKRMLKKNIKIQAESLRSFHKLDELAAEFQEKGVSILCNDIPHIAIPSSDVIHSIYSNLK